MFYVYVLRSLKNNKQYTGFTSKKPLARLEEHNNGSNVFTIQNGPFELIHAEEHKDESFARKRERFLKTGHGRSFLKKRLKAPVAQPRRTSGQKRA